MASATFSLKAVDETRTAFAAVQNSLGKLNATSASVGKTLKTMMMGGLSKSFLKTLDAMGDKLDKVITEGEDIGFGQSIEDALRLKSIIDGFFKLLLVIPAAFAKIGISIGDLVTGTTDAEAKAKAMELWTKRFQKDIDESVDSTKKLQVEFDKTEQTSEQWGDSLRKAAEQSFLLSQTQFQSGKDIAKAYKSQEEGLKLLLEEATLRKKIKEDRKKAEDDLAQAFNERTKAQNKLDRIGSKALTTEQELGLLYKDKLIQEEYLNNLKGEGIDIVRVRTDAEKKLKETIEEIVKLEEQRRQFGMEFGARIADSFEEAILSGTKLREVIRALAQDLLRMIFREQITKPMASGLGNFFANLFTGKATGGPVSGGTPYMVGEKGPELFVPGSSGSIIPNNRLGSGGGGGSSVNVTYNISSGVNKAELMPILENERKRLKAEIPDMVRRGGAYRAAFA
jgi:hypothetical protein